MNRFSVKDKRVFLTGASGYLGSMMREVLTEEGATVISPARDEFTHLEFERFENYGPYDVLINNAHPMDWGDGRSWDIHKHTQALEWATMAIQHFGFGMQQHGGGSIINIASMYALIAPNPKLYEGTEFMNPIGYGIAKAGMLALTRYVASFWGKYNIRCNAIVPGAFPKPSVPDDFKKRLEERTALGRVGLPEDLAGALLFLASDASSYMTGQTLVIDGGWTIT